MHRRLLAVATAAFATAAFMVALASPASADGTCAAGYFCVWSGGHYTGNKYVFQEFHFDGDPIIFEQPGVRSAKNRLGNGFEIDLYDDEENVVATTPDGWNWPNTTGPSARTGQCGSCW